MTNVCPKCGEPFAWLERRRRGDRVYLYAVHERTENGVRRRRRCYLGVEEEAGRKPEEARAWEGPEAEEVLSEGEGEEGIEPAALTPLAAPTEVGGPGPYEDEFRELVRWARSRGLTPCDVMRRLGIRSPRCEEEGKPEEAAPRREGEGDLLAEAGRAIRVRAQVDLLRGMGILKEEGRGGSATLDAPDILMLMSAGGRDEVDLKELLPYAIIMKALGGEKSSDWKDLMAVLVPLLQQGKRKEVDPLALLDMMEEAERGAREEEGERWRALAEALRGRRPPEEGSGFGGEVGRLVGERLRAALAAEEPRGAEVPEGRPTEAEGAMGRPGPLQVLRRGAATTHGTLTCGNHPDPGADLLPALKGEA